MPRFLTGPFLIAAALNAAAPHPRMILDAPMLSTLRARAASGPPEWTSLKERCDALAGMPVRFFDQSGSGLGEGYQGGEYFNAVMSLGLCRHVVEPDHPAPAARYGEKLLDILKHMSDPAHSPPPGRDNGYGVRFYVLGMAYGYDWGSDLLDPPTKRQLWTAMNRWLSVFETDGCCNWEWAHPNSNYYAAYYHAKAAAALATEGDNPDAPAMWDDWIRNQHGARVEPWFGRWLAGGGWPEGFPNYGPGAVLNHALPAIIVRTAKGIDLIHGDRPFQFPFESADYLMHFTWPGLNYTDDRGTAHAVKEGEPPAGTTHAGLFTALAGMLRYWNAPHAAVFQQYAANVLERAARPQDIPAWQQFLWWDPRAPAAPLSTLPRSYFAPGLNHAAARSDWTPEATWLSFIAGLYLNNPSQGEQRFDEGSLALVRGATPLLVNASAWLMHNSPGTNDGAAGEQAVERSNWGRFKTNPAYGNRDIYSIFYARRLDATGAPVEPWGQDEFGPGEADTRIALFEDCGSYVLAVGTKLEEMYRRSGAAKLLAGWTREVFFVRPNRVIVYDRTAAGAPELDQFLAWHFPAEPLSAGPRRLDVTYDSRFAGSMTTVLPAGALVTVGDLYGLHKVWRAELRPADHAVAHDWLTVFDLSSSPREVASAAPIQVATGSAVGVSLKSEAGNTVVIAVTPAPGLIESEKLVYAAPAAARHFITGLTPGLTYRLSVSGTGDQRTITLLPAGPLIASASGVLEFEVGE